MNILSDHWLDSAKRELIPGGAAMAIRRYLVIHYTAGATALSSINYWRQLANGVCAHFVIDRDGTIYQCRPCNRTAGHAGESRWRDPVSGRVYERLNHCSIGIELANAGDSREVAAKWSSLPLQRAEHKHGGGLREWEPYPPAQYLACESLSRVLVTRYNLDDLMGHDDIAPRRKPDPGPLFPMATLRAACGFPTLFE